jgi:UDP-N-acetylmuramoylalanine--D-glutamate ligase
LQGLEQFDIVCRTASINPNTIVAASPGAAGKITTVINEFLRVCPTRNTIGITGTKGKGTTSTLITKMLEAAGKDVFLGGNIGRSPLDFLADVTADSWVVLELSSFQLYDLQHSPHTAICLMVVPEHLNWHSDVDDYIAAKRQLFSHQTARDVAIYFADNQVSRQIASASPGIKLAYYAEPGVHVQDGAIIIGDTMIAKVSELRLLGAHNWQNVCAAITAVWQSTQDVAAIRSVLTTFTGLEHRLEFVREHEGVRYYDDSFGTTPGTAIVAIQAFRGPKIVILGGSDKGADYTELARIVAASNVRQVIAIGQMGDKLSDCLRQQGFTAITSGGATMTSIITACRAYAKNGDVVLLSTACASFGMFTDYKDRGTQFKAVVSAL